ncbi:T9SS type A sorting domain-containing protein [Polaribacter sp. NJDZ03]|uniref:T9SS type A sorting domain-containing protein n=1 Tax=Polaribacter sp. NJDZ03 TaxID=2855841 RepID=UPI001C4A0348|nr:T9SS type A sorting domain-containing protein [Polaribacter sp. NJDZ03]
MSAQEPVTTVYGDFGGFYTSSTTSRVDYDDSNNLIGFTVNGVTYSTGVNDALLTSKNITYTPEEFKAFPIPADIVYKSTDLVGIGSNWGGVTQDNSATDYIKTFDPIVPSSFVRDGINGLELATNFFNIQSQVIIYDALIINQSSTITDEAPDIIVTQTGAPGSTDKFKFIDTNGNTVGSELSVRFNNVPIVGGTFWTIYQINTTTGTVSGTFAKNSHRDLRVLSIKLSDFGITTSNFTQVNNFVHNTSGDTDIAFTAFNTDALEINLPATDLEVSNSNIIADNFCAPTTATFTTTITNNSKELTKDFDVDLDFSGVTVTSSSSNFTTSGTSIFSASFNSSSNKWIISELEAGASVTLSVETSVDAFSYPISFTATAIPLFQPDSNSTNNTLSISENGDDNDCDGVNDADDLDDDNDGILDSVEGTGDLDGDGIPNYLDLDSDGDGCPDALEGAGTVNITQLGPNFVIIGAVNSDGVPTLVEAGSGLGQAIGDSQNSSVQNCDTTDTDLDGVIDLVDLDDDNDGILDSVEGTGDDDGDGVINSLDTDSDGDGCPDALEGSANFTLADVDVNNRLTGNVDEDGIPLLATSTGQTVGDSQNDSVQDEKCSLLPVIISQVYQTSAGTAIELTNIGTSTVTNIRLAMFKDTASPSDVLPTSSIVIPTLTAGSSVVIKSVDTLPGVTLINSPTEITDANITDLANGNDIIILSTTVDASTWANRYDVVSNVSDVTSLVRIDEITKANTAFTSSEWINFIDDTISVLGDTNPIAAIVRHANAPLISEVKNPHSNANDGLGLHRINPTVKTASGWSNGFPDKSRSVIIQDSYEHSSGNLLARKLNVQGSSVLSISNNALVVLNNIHINVNAQIRILGSGQFIQVHDGDRNVTGNGKLLIDQKSETPNVYRYNYWSSPVVEFEGGNNYRVSKIMKDARGELLASSTLSDINFISGYDGAATNPIQIASHWIWTYSGTSNNNWVQVKETGAINKGFGYIMKSTGVNPQYFTFSGSPLDGDISFNISGNTNSLIGNPYAGTLDGHAFILNNENTIDGTLYFWEHSGEATDSGHVKGGYEGGYAQLTYGMGVAATSVVGINGLTDSYSYTTPTRYIAVGQGFFIYSDADGGTVNFNNKQRSYQATAPHFFKGQQKKIANSTLPILKLGMDFTNKDYLKIHRQIGVSFNENHSYAFDYGYESVMIDVQASDIFWNFEEMNHKKLVIAGVEDISDALKVPLTILVDSDEPLFLRIDELENIDRKIYLFDAVENTTRELKTDEVVELTLSKGTYDDRFFITFNEAKVLSVSNEVLDFSLRVYMDNNSNAISIRNNTNLFIENVAIFNVLGQQIKAWNPNVVDEKIDLEVGNLSTSIYIVKVKTNKGTFTSKILKK